MARAAGCGKGRQIRLRHGLRLEARGQAIGPDRDWFGRREPATGVLSISSLLIETMRVDAAGGGMQIVGKLGRVLSQNDFRTGVSPNAGEGLWHGEFAPPLGAIDRDENLIVAPKIHGRS